MAASNGYSRKLLRVDLGEQKITEEEIDESTARKFLGGTGIGAMVLWNEVPAGVEWSDEANRLIIASGPLGGTSIGGSGTVSVVTKGPLSNGAGACQANGFFGAFIRFLGYDGLILQGKAKDWQYLYLHDGKAELRDASHLVGKDTWETTDSLKQELGVTERTMAVASIGPAGENLVKFASIFFDKGHTASHNGNGAVMGSKKLKAIAVARSQSRPPVKNRETLSGIAEQLHQNILNTPGWRGTYEYGTLNAVHDRTLAGDGIVPVKNYSTNIYDIKPEDLERFYGPYIRSHYDPEPCPCWACRMHHCHMITLSEGPYKGYYGEEPEYECFATFGPVIGNTDATGAIYLSNELDRLGMDVNETGWVMGLAIECYEKGVITRDDTNGIELTWGNVAAVDQMMRKVATREGFGDILAEGAMRAAQRIGGDAPRFAVHTMKGNTPRGHDHRNRWAMLFDTCVSQMSSDEGYTVARPSDFGWDIKPSLGTNFDAEDTLKWNILCKGGHQFEDCLGTCRFTTRTDVKALAEALSAVTGWDFSKEEAMQVGRRVVTLLRAFNMRHGHTAEMDAPSPRYAEIPKDGPSKGKDIKATWDDMRRRYYEAMGWDGKTGKPLAGTLKQLGLEEVVGHI